MGKRTLQDLELSAGLSCVKVSIRLLIDRNGRHAAYFAKRIRLYFMLVPHEREPRRIVAHYRNAIIYNL